MRRRKFIGLVGGIAVAWPLAARGQQSLKLPIIGFLGADTAAAMSHLTTAFVEQLRELGWIEGRTVTIDYRWADGHLDRGAEIFAEFVELKVDVIVTHSTALSVAAKKATAVIPIVFAAAGDPVGNRIVASLARPGGNITGLSTETTDPVGKRLQLLREIVPDVGHVTILANVNNPITALTVQKFESAAGALGLNVNAIEIRTPEDVTRAIETLKGHANALYIPADPLLITDRDRLFSLALGARLLTMNELREYVEAGGLISYGARFSDLFRRAAIIVDKILRGTKPGDIPVEQPTKFELVINLKTAKALGLDIPPTVLALADEVIE